MRIKDIAGWPSVRACAFTVCVAVLFGVCFISTEFYELDWNSFGSLATIIAQWAVVVFATFCLILILIANKYIFAITLPILTTVCAILAYFRVTVKAQITAATIDLALINDSRTCIEVVSSQLIGITAVAFIASCIIAYIRFRFIDFGKYWYVAPLFGIAFLAMTVCTRLKAPVFGRIPFSVCQAIKDYLSSQRYIAEQRPILTANATCNTDTLTVVMVIGESLRSSNLGVNGYERQTTPLLAKEPNAVSLPNVHTIYGATHLCVPYMLTRADSLHQDFMYIERSFISIFKQAGYSTAWLANQEKVDTYAYFMNEADTLQYANSGKSSYITTEWLDSDLLPIYKATLNKANQLKLIILHTIGSHWYYDGHYTDEFKKWKPTTNSKVTSYNTHEQFVNSYDNTILESDNFWHNVIDTVRNRKSIVIYLSDHAECQGEDGIYLHAQDHPALLSPACWIWYSDSFASAYPSKVEKLRANHLRKLDSAFLFHSIIDAGDIATDIIEPKYDIFK